METIFASDGKEVNLENLFNSMQILSTTVAVCVYIWENISTNTSDCVSFRAIAKKKKRRERRQKFTILEQQEKANIKRANKTQHKSKLVKTKFSEFFNSLCCWLLYRLLLLQLFCRDICINFLLLAHFHTLIIQLSFYLLHTWIPMNSFNSQLLSSYVKLPQTLGKRVFFCKLSKP